MIVERDVVLTGETEDGQPTLDLPVTRLGNIEDSADVKETLEDADYFPVADSKTGMLKKTPWSRMKALFAGKSHTHAAADITGSLGKEQLTGVKPSDIGAAAADHGHTAADVGAASATHNHSAADITGTLAASHGGTGRSSMTANALVCGAGTAAVNLVAAPGESGFLYDAGGVLPEWKNAEQARGLMGAAGRVVWRDITVNTSAWAASGSYFAATVSVSGMLATDNPHSVDIMRTADLAADEVCEAAFALVKRITTANGSITLYAKEKPGSNFKLWMEGTR